MKTSLKDTIQKEYAETLAPAVTATVSPEAEALVTVDDRFFNNEDMVGDFDRSDIKVPSLNLCQAVGPLSTKFTPGQFVWNKEEVIGDQNNPIHVTVRRMRKYFQEKLPYGSETLPRRFDSEKEARAAGLAMSWDKIPGAGIFERVVDCEVYIRGTKEKNPAWALIAGEPTTAARLTLKGTSYTAAQSFITAASYNLREGMHHGIFEIRSSREKFGTNMVWVPKVRLIGRHTPEAAAEIHSL